MNLEFGICRNCGRDRLIVNKKYCLCESCNRLRLDKSKVDIPKKAYLSVHQRKPSKNKSINNVSKKEVKNLNQLRKVYSEIDQERPLKCEGCGQSSFLSHSHLISQRNKLYQSDKDNIVFHCMEREVSDKFGNKGCHARWESGQWNQITTLFNYQNHLDYIKTRDSIQYNKIILTRV